MASTEEERVNVKIFIFHPETFLKFINAKRFYNKNLTLKELLPVIHEVTIDVSIPKHDSNDIDCPKPSNIPKNKEILPAFCSKYKETCEAGSCHFENNS